MRCVCPLWIERSAAKHIRWLHRRLPAPSVRDSRLAGHRVQKAVYNAIVAAASGGGTRAAI